MKVFVDEKVKHLIKTRFRSDAKVINNVILKLKDNPKMGDYVFGIDNFDVREIKIKGLRIFTAQYKDILYIELDENFKEIIKVMDIVKKNKTKQQQQTIDDIKKRLKSFGMNIE